MLLFVLLLASCSAPAIESKEEAKAEEEAEAKEKAKPKEIDILQSEIKTNFKTGIKEPNL